VATGAIGESGFIRAQVLYVKGVQAFIYMEVIGMGQLVALTLAGFGGEMTSYLTILLMILMV
jgi:hypothetical protein